MHVLCNLASSERTVTPKKVLPSGMDQDASGSRDLGVGLAIKNTQFFGVSYAPSQSRTGVKQGVAMDSTHLMVMHWCGASRT